MLTSIWGIFFAACLHSPSFHCYILPPPPCDYTVPVCYNYDPKPIIDKPGKGP